MEEIIMNKKKQISGTITILLILSIVTSALSVQAASLRTVYGIVYIDGLKAPDGTTVKLTFPDQEITNNTFGNGHFVMNFMEDDWAEGTFSVFYLGYWRPTNPPTVGLGDQDELHYHVDLYVSLSANTPPNAPTLISPGDGSTIGGTTSATLKVSVSDPDGNSMNVSFYNANGDTLIGTINGVLDGSTASKTWSGLSPGNLYNWYATANDGEYTVQSSSWSFKTATEGGGGNSGGNGGGNGDDNGGGGTAAPVPPIADANGPYIEILYKILGYAEVKFDGTSSSGTITSYSWDFGDGTKGTGKSPTHEYTALDNYTVILNVSGPLGFSISQTYALILPEPNIPPTNPIVSGPQTGIKNFDYDYTAVSNDYDNGRIKYIFNWGDGTSKTTDYFNNGTAVTESHNWSAAGVHIIKVKASDDATESGTTNYVVLIDAIWVKNIGYLMDTDGDGTYDSFYSNETGETTVAKKQDNGTYLINNDKDDGWDWIYDPETDTLTQFSEKKEEELFSTILYTLGLGTILAIVIFIIFLVTKKRKKPKKKASKKKRKKPKKKASKTKKK
jgi:hypothetical protein